jgi:RNA polymerase sigma-54 factor
MKLSLDIKTSLSQRLTPQQIQYLKLLQMPVIQMEQQIKQEIDENPMLEEIEDDFEIAETNEEASPDTHDFDIDDNPADDNFTDDVPPEKQIDDEKDPFEFYNMIWQDDSEFKPSQKYNPDDNDDEPYPIKAQESFIEDLNNQLTLFPLKEEYKLLGSHIIGNIDDDGYLRRQLNEIVDETNSAIADHNFQIQRKLYDLKNSAQTNKNGNNPALMYALSDDSKSMLERAEILSKESLSSMSVSEKKAFNPNDTDEQLLEQVSIDEAEKVLKLIQSLEPPGIASRNIRECLLAQCRVIQKPDVIQKLATKILQETYDSFIKKHYNVITKHFEISDDQLRKALDFIKSLNPKPGIGDFSHETNTVIPDFIIEREKDTEELIITLNDSRMPKVTLNKAYEKLRSEAKQKKFNKEIRNWIRNKHEDAKFLIQAIRQRKNTMLKVMTAIAKLQRDFFDVGRAGLKPLIYKDVAEKTALDISTVCRIVNGKYVQTDFGTFELKFFFSESLPNIDGEEISTTVIKEKLKEIIDKESKKKPLSDVKISEMLKEEGFNVARRTVAKYREQLKIPVARLRKEL